MLPIMIIIGSMGDGENGGDREEDQHAEEGKGMFPQQKTGKKTHSEEDSAKDSIIHRLGEDVVLEEKGQNIVHLAQKGIAGEDVSGDEIKSMMEEIEFRCGEVVDQRILAYLRGQDQEKTGKKEDPKNDLCREVPDGTCGRRSRNDLDSPRPAHDGKQRQRYQEKVDAIGIKRTCNAEEKYGITGDGDSDTGRDEKFLPPGSEADKGCTQTEPSETRCDQTPTGQKKDRNAMLNKCRPHGFLRVLTKKG